MRDAGRQKKEKENWGRKWGCERGGDWWDYQAGWRNLQCWFTAQISKATNSQQTCAGRFALVTTRDWAASTHAYLTNEFHLHCYWWLAQLSHHSQGSLQSALNTASIWDGVSKFRDQRNRERKQEMKKEEGQLGKREMDSDSKVQRTKDAGIPKLHWAGWSHAQGQHLFFKAY